MVDSNAFKIKKTFGLGVLMKLTKRINPGIEITTQGDRFVSNVGINRFKDALKRTVDSHNIRFKL